MPSRIPPLWAKCRRATVTERLLRLPMRRFRRPDGRRRSIRYADTTYHAL